jgi:hypothetical protein
MTAPFNPDGCFYMDDEGVVFSIAAFILRNELPDDPRLRAVIAEEMREMFPDIRVLEELN